MDWLAGVAGTPIGALIALAAGILVLCVVTLGGRGARNIPASKGGPSQLKPNSGPPPDLHAEKTAPLTSATSERAEIIIYELRRRAAEQLIEHLGGTYAPSILRSLLDDVDGPVEAIRRLIQLVGEDAKAVLAGPGEARTAFLDRLDAFIQLEAEVRSIAPESNRQIFALLQEGRADDVRRWAASVKTAHEVEALLTHAESLAPGPIGLIETLKAEAESIVRRICTPTLPLDLKVTTTTLEDLSLAAKAVFRFAEDWHDLDRKRDRAEAEISARYDPRDPFCKSLLTSMQPVIAAMEASWKTIAQRRASIAELRGLLDDLDRGISQLARFADDLKAHAASSARSGGSAGTGGGPHRKRSGTYGPDGRDSKARANTDPFQSVWEFFGFDFRPTLDQCRAARNKLLRMAHPDLVGEAGKIQTQKINAMWTLAQEKLRDVRV